MDVNKVFLSGYVNYVNPIQALADGSKRCMFWITSKIYDSDYDGNAQTGNGRDNKIANTTYQIYLDLNTQREKEAFEHVKLGKSLVIEGFLKNYRYHDSIGKTHSLSRIKATHIQPLS